MYVQLPYLCDSYTIVFIKRLYDTLISSVQTFLCQLYLHISVCIIIFRAKSVSHVPFSRDPRSLKKARQLKAALAERDLLREQLARVNKEKQKLSKKIETAQKTRTSQRSKAIDSTPIPEEGKKKKTSTNPLTSTQSTSTNNPPTHTALPDLDLSGIETPVAIQISSTPAALIIEDPATPVIENASLNLSEIAESPLQSRRHQVLQTQPPAIDAPAKPPGHLTPVLPPQHPAIDSPVRPPGQPEMNHITPVLRPQRQAKPTPPTPYTMSASFIEELENLPTKEEKIQHAVPQMLTVAQVRGQKPKLKRVIMQQPVFEQKTATKYMYAKRTATSHMLEMSVKNVLPLTPRERSTFRQDKAAGMTSLITKFLQEENNSYTLPGKRDVTKDGKTRYALTDTMKNLHTRFCTENPLLSIGRSTFCSKINGDMFREVKYTQRHIALCTSHTNMALLCQAAGLPASSTELLREDDKQILERATGRLEGREYVQLKQWLPGDCNIPKFDKKGQPKQRIKITMLVKSKEELLKLLEDTVPEFREHCKRKNNQSGEARFINMTIEQWEITIQLDYAESWTIISMEEIQSAFFASENITMSPFVIRMRNQAGDIISLTYIGLSDVKSHSTATTVSFLKQLIPLIRFEGLEMVHFLSDSPGSQYRNRYIAYFVKHFGEFFPGLRATWTWFEVGHGKGPCDGAGGAMKRQADRFVKRGHIIANAADFKEKLQDKTSMRLILASKEQVDETQAQVKAWKAPQCEGIGFAHALVPKDGEMFINVMSCFQPCCRDPTSRQFPLACTRLDTPWEMLNHPVQPAARRRGVAPILRGPRLAPNLDGVQRGRGRSRARGRRGRGGGGRGGRGRGRGRNMMPVYSSESEGEGEETDPLEASSSTDEDESTSEDSEDFYALELRSSSDDNE